MTRRMLGGLDLGLMEAIFDQQPDCPFFVKDRELRYVAANVAMMRLCGARDRDEILGKTAAAFFPPDLQRRYEAMDRQVMDSGAPITERLELSQSVRRTSSWLFFSRFPVLDGAQRPVGVVATSRSLNWGDVSHPLYRRLAAVIDRIRENIDRPLELNRLAALAGVSPSQLERDFSRTFRMTLREHHRRVRLEGAIRLLQSELSVARVAAEMGYADHSAFSRQFRQATGATPSEFRRRLLAGEDITTV